MVNAVKRLVWFEIILEFSRFAQGHSRLRLASWPMPKQESCVPLQRRPSFSWVAFERECVRTFGGSTGCIEASTTRTPLAAYEALAVRVW